MGITAYEPTEPVRVPVLARARDPRARRWRLVAPGLLLAVVAMVLVAVVYGSNFVISPADVTRIVLGREVEPLVEFGARVRLPRALLAVLVGAALAVAGALLQALTRNPLASPDIVGVSQGVVAAVLLVTLLGRGIGYDQVGVVVPLAGAAGGLLTAMLIIALTRRLGSQESTQFILVGVLVGGILTSMSSLALIFLGSEASQVLGFIAGSLDLKTAADLRLVGYYLVPGVVLLLLAVPRVNALQLGDDVARGLGQDIGRDRVVVLAAAVLLTAGAVSVVGALSFVGLMAPHMVRGLVGSDMRRLVPASALAGALIVLAADLASRNLQPGRLVGDDGSVVGVSTLPTGVYLALVGVPFMITLMWRRR